MDTIITVDDIKETLEMVIDRGNFTEGAKALWLTREAVRRRCRLIAPKLLGGQVVKVKRCGLGAVVLLTALGKNLLCEGSNNTVFYMIHTRRNNG